MKAYINKNKVDSLEEQPLKNLINESVIVLLKELGKYEQFQLSEHTT